MRNSSNVLSLILVILILSGFSTIGSSMNESISEIMGVNDIEPPTRWSEKSTNMIISPGDEGIMRITDNISSEGEMAFTFERNSLRSFASLPSTVHTSQDIGNGNVIASDGPYTFVAHIIRGTNGAWYSFWLSRYDRRTDLWDPSLEIYNVSGIQSAGCELTISGGQIFYGLYLISAQGTNSHLYVKHIDLDSWTGIIDTVALKVDRDGDVVKGGKFLSVDNRLLVFWMTESDECFMATYTNLQWSEPRMVLIESTDFAPEVLDASSGNEIILIYRKNLNDNLNVISSSTFGLSWSAPIILNISFPGEIIQITTTSYQGMIQMMIVQRGDGIVKLFRSENGIDYTYSGFTVDVGTIDQMDGRFQGHITADRSQVVITLESGNGAIDIYVSDDKGLSYTLFDTVGSDAWCPVLDEDKGYISYSEGDELVLKEFTSSTSGRMRSRPLYPMGISSWEDFGFLVDGFGPGSSLSMRIVDKDGSTQLFPDSGFVDILSLGSGNIDGDSYTHYGLFTGDWRSTRTGLSGPIMLELFATRADEDQPAILDISLNHTNSFPFDFDITSTLPIVSMANMTLRPSGVQIDNLQPKGSFIIGPIEKEEEEWCDLIDISFSSIGTSARIKVGIRDSTMGRVRTFSPNDCTIITDTSAPGHIKWGMKYLKDLPTTIEEIFLEFVVEVEEPNTRTTVERFSFLYSEEPQFEDVSLKRDRIHRGEKTRLYVNVTDNEELESSLKVQVILLDPVSGEWTEDLVEGQKWEVDRWSIPITTTYSSNIGTWDMKVTVIDSMGNSTDLVDAPSIEIMNNRPIAPGIFIIPDIPTTGDELGIEIFRDGTDLETFTENLTYNFRLYRDSELYIEILNHTEMSLTVEEGIIVEGEIWDVVVTTWDGLVESQPSVHTITVFNSLPFDLDHPSNITINEDETSEGYDYMFWFDDKDGEDLSYDLTISEGIDIHLLNGSVMIVPQENFNGEGLLTILASDEDGSARVNIKIIVNPLNDPPIIEALNDTQVEQGQWLEYSIISYDMADDEPVEVDIDLRAVIPGVKKGINFMELSNGSFRLFATNDMVGKHAITVTATDGKSTVNTTFSIDVIDVNDAPLKPVIEVNEGKWIFSEDENIFLKAIADDPDSPWGDVLTYRWTSSISGELGSAETLEVQLEPGIHLIMLEVFDSEMTSNSTSVTIEVKSMASEMNEVMETATFLILIGAIALVVGLIISLLLFFLVKNKRQRKKEQEEEKKEEEPTNEGEGEKKKEENKKEEGGNEDVPTKDQEKEGGISKTPEEEVKEISEGGENYE